MKYHFDYRSDDGLEVGRGTGGKTAGIRLEVERPDRGIFQMCKLKWIGLKPVFSSVILESPRKHFKN